MRQHALPRFSVAAALCAALAACAPMGGGVTRVATPMAVDAARAAAVVSAYRAAHGLGPVRVDASLMAVAGAQARAMARADRLDHSVAGSFGARIEAGGVGTSNAVENVAGGYRDLRSVIEGWEASPEHDANLLAPAVTRLGIAAFHSAGSRLDPYWSLDMAR
ncbi:MAG: CAP domain-containing protein [Hyphomicrobiales bacterium]|nr:CAP domain-containing protein [Hyphomicrobiales bacterium]